MILRIHSGGGFVLPVLLGIVLLAALLAAHSAAELANSTLLTTQRQLNQRAFEAGESGIVLALERLRTGIALQPAQTLRAANAATDSATVQTLIATRQLLPVGHSAGRVIETDYEIRSTGRSARRSQVTVVQGARQLRVAGE
jgi:Tfp pilus assembly protein PilX